jgi:hypothetical protein
VARYLVLWRQNPSAPNPTTPSENLQLNEMMFVAIDDLMARGDIEEFGFFSDGRSGYVIGKGETIDSFRNVSTYFAFYSVVVPPRMHTNKRAHDFSFTETKRFKI